MNKSVLMIFLKPFVEGKVKTRLAQRIGNRKALDVYKLLVRHTVQEASKLPDSVRIILFYSEDAIPSLTYGGGYESIIQCGDTLGDKMAFAINWAEEQGYERKVIIGSDCATLNIKHLEDAYIKLLSKDVVIGPAKDGGYYLIGMTKPQPSLFRDIKWSTSEVYDKTLHKMLINNLSFAPLEILSDIDVVEDLDQFPELLKEVLE